MKAVYDTAGPVRLTLSDTSGREFSVGSVAGPVHRIYWLDDPPIDRVLRNSLTRAFNEAAMYDEAARTAHGSGALEDPASRNRLLAQFASPMLPVSASPRSPVPELPSPQ